MPANWYVDASATGDGGNATSTGTAKQHLRPVMLFLNRSLDQTIWIRGGRYYDVDAPGNGMPSMSGTAHVTIRPYGESGNPVLDARNWIAPSTGISNLFTYEGPAQGGGAVWSRQIGTSARIVRVWAASVNRGVLLSQRTVGEALRQVPDAVTDTLSSIQAALNENDCWYGAGSTLGYKLYMWTPTRFADPADYYQGLSFTQSGAGALGFDHAFRITRAQDILIQNIDCMASRADAILVESADSEALPTRGIRIENCNALGVFASGFRVRQTSTAAGIANKLCSISDVLFKNCTADTSTSAREQEPSTAYSRLSGASDLFYFSGRIDNVRAEDCTSVNGYHCGATLGTMDSNASPSMRSGFRRHKVRAAAWATYARGYSTFMCEPTCFIDQCEADGMNVTSQFSGAPLVTSSVWKNQRPAMRKLGLDAEGVISIGAYMIDGGNTGIGADRYTQLKPTNVRIHNCSFGPAYGAPIQFGALYSTAGSGQTPGTIEPGTVNIEYCLFMDTMGNRRTAPVLTTYQEGGLVIGDQNISNNCFFKGDASVTPTVEYRGATYSINAAPGFASTLTLDPKVGPDMRPKRGSPLIGGGKGFGGRLRDASGRQMNNKRPIGAYDDFSADNRGAR